MEITKTSEVGKIEVVGGWIVQVAMDIVIKEDDKEISRSRHRHVLYPCISSKGEDGKWTHTDTDISGEEDAVKAVCNAVWTSDIVAKYKSSIES